MIPFCTFFIARSVMTKQLRPNKKPALPASQLAELNQVAVSKSFGWIESYTVCLWQMLSSCEFASVKLQTLLSNCCFLMMHFCTFLVVRSVMTKQLRPQKSPNHKPTCRIELDSC
jgi:hypothetical protein